MLWYINVKPFNNMLIFTTLRSESFIDHLVANLVWRWKYFENLSNISTFKYSQAKKTSNLPWLWERKWKRTRSSRVERGNDRVSLWCSSSVVGPRKRYSAHIDPTEVLVHCKLTQVHMPRGSTIDCDTVFGVIYVAAKVTYIRLLHGKMGFFGGFFGPSSVKRGRTHIVLGWNM